jgi:hypothetical protein
MNTESDAQVKDAQKRDYISLHTLIGRLREGSDAGELVLSARERTRA